jgi:hypothetical protein
MSVGFVVLLSTIWLRWECILSGWSGVVFWYVVAVEVVLGFADVGSVVVDETGVPERGVEVCVGVLIGSWIKDDSVLGGEWFVNGRWERRGSWQVVIDGKEKRQEAGFLTVDSGGLAAETGLRRNILCDMTRRENIIHICL